MTGGARHAHVVPVDVLEKHLGVPAGQRARLEHEEMTLMREPQQTRTPSCLTVLNLISLKSF